MKKKPLLRMEIAFVIVLFIGIGILPSISGNTKESREIVNDVEHPLSDVTVTITYPEDGIYWNDQKIFWFFVTLVICGDLGFEVEIETSPYVEIDYVELYVNDGLQYVYFTPPFEFGPYCLNIPFSKNKIGIIAYTINGDQGSDEITIWRIFS